MATKARQKQARARYAAWQRSTDYNLYDAYGRFSQKKASAWKYCKKLMADNEGWDLKIISHNTFQFTAGFEFTDKETGVLMFMWITPSDDVAVEV